MAQKKKKKKKQQPQQNKPKRRRMGFSQMVMSVVGIFVVLAMIIGMFAR